VGSTTAAPRAVLSAGARKAGVGRSGERLRARLAWPCHPSGFVLLARVGDGERLREDERLADQLGAAGIGTALIDLLPAGAASGDEADAERLVHNIHTATTWLKRQPEAAGLPVGCFGAGASVAPVLAAARGASAIEAVVALGDRPDLVEELAAVTAPTLLLVGRGDEERQRLARAALARLGGPKHMVAIRGPGPPFTDATALEEAGRWAAAWFVQHLAMERAWRAAHERPSGGPDCTSY